MGRDADAGAAVVAEGWPMTIKTTARAAFAAALVSFAVWGVAQSASSPAYTGAHAMHHHAAGKFDQGLARKLARARVATAPYVSNLDLAKADGYRIITPMMKNMGFHYLNPGITGFDVTKPHILVYTRRDGKYQLGALEWVFPKKPKHAPLKGAKYGSFPAACHYDDGTFSPASSEDDCKPTSPESGSPFVFWHPDLVTLHVWIWNPNPDGLYASTNPLVRPFNGG
jgi:hypothetical protein